MKFYCNVSVGKWKFPCSQFCTAVSRIHFTPLIAPRNLDRKYKIILNFIDVKNIFYWCIQLIRFPHLLSINIREKSMCGFWSHLKCSNKHFYLLWLIVISVGFAFKLLDLFLIFKFDLINLKIYHKFWSIK